MIQPTAQYRSVMEGAKDLAIAFQHGYIGSEHLLLAVYLDREGHGATILESLGVTDESKLYQCITKALEGVNYVAGRTQRNRDLLLLNPAAQLTSMLAQTAAEAYKASKIGTEHLVIGLAEASRPGVEPSTAVRALLYYGRIEAIILEGTARNFIRTAGDQYAPR